MRLRHIEVFHAIKQTGSISRAAALLGVSQPAASKVLQHAESALGFKLFERIKGRLHPTPEAEVLHVEVAKLHQGLEQVRLLSANLRHDPKGRLRVGCLPSLGLSIVPPAIRAFRAAYPSVRCEIRTDHVNGLLDALRARELDIAVTLFPRPYPGITARVLNSVELVYLGPVPGPETIELADVDVASLIGVSRTDRIGAMVADELEQLGRPFSPWIEVETYFLACSLAAAGCGAAIVDRLTAGSMVRPGLHLCRIRPSLEVSVGVLIHDVHVGDRLNAEFTQLIRRAMVQNSVDGGYAG